MSELRELQTRALEIANLYDEYNRASGQTGKDLRDYVKSLIDGVGGVKAAMASKNKRDEENLGENLERELNNILWSVLMLFYALRVSPDKSFMGAMDELEKKLIGLKERKRQVR